MEPTNEIADTRFDVRAADGTPIAVWVDGLRAGARDGPRLDRRSHHVRLVRRRARPTTSRLTRWIAAASAPAATPPTTRSSATSRTSPPSSTPSPARTGGPVAAVGPLLRGQLRDGWRRPHRQRPPPRALRAELRPAVPAGIDRRASDAALADGEHERGDGRRCSPTSVGMTEAEIDAIRVRARCGRRAGRRPHDPPRVPRRAGLGRHVPGSSPTSRRPTLLLAGTDSVAVDRRGHPAGRCVTPRCSNPRNSPGTVTWPTRPDPAMVAAIISEFVLG